ncbi:GNAT family N-acetyltransferase [Yoonia litorea]|uniref:N-acetylglutamate synthase, GNAT family n=1 Tax=Yoonia litorea TaxID=1123755 RepID=A0A1I6N1S8_9RHOB|nr:GNAT family N-acetyltransferase [Yoonia litorea]SFS21896.1 N-acetylglutamate synthase, GNAT family [Yoonia litorea]
MIIRRASDDDAEALTALITAAYAPYQHLGLPPVAEGVADDITRHYVWVAEVAGVVRGGIVLIMSGDAYIANLAVHPDAGGQGIGSALISKACDLARCAGFEEIGLATHVGMTETQAFYRRLGWIETGHEGLRAYFKKDL